MTRSILNAAIWRSVLRPMNRNVMSRSNESAPTRRLRGFPTWTFETKPPDGKSFSNDLTMAARPFFVPSARFA